MTRSGSVHDGTRWPRGRRTVPVSRSFPIAPVAVQISVMNAMILPRLASPSMMLEIISPSLIKMSVKSWVPPVIPPSPVIVSGSVPMPLPRTPPPSAVEKYVFVQIRYNIDVRTRNDHNFRRRRKDNRRRKRNGNVDMHAGLCDCQNRCEAYQR